MSRPNSLHALRKMTDDLARRVEEIGTEWRSSSETLGADAAVAVRSSGGHAGKVRAADEAVHSAASAVDDAVRHLAEALRVVPLEAQRVGVPADREWM